jgi:hypothetical protein
MPMTVSGCASAMHAARPKKPVFQTQRHFNCA